jgi:hypothetical protein
LSEKARENRPKMRKIRPAPRYENIEFGENSENNSENSENYSDSEPFSAEISLLEISKPLGGHFRPKKGAKRTGKVRFFTFFYPFFFFFFEIVYIFIYLFEKLPIKLARLCVFFWFFDNEMCLKCDVLYMNTRFQKL